jgi:hypothetical protein
MLAFQDKVRIFEKKLKKFLSNHDAIFVQKTIKIDKLDKNNKHLVSEINYML